MPYLPLHQDEKLLVGTEAPDDAAVYLLDKERALIQTLDFFPPVVDDPFSYGQIAAANALSDVYAMGGKPLTAMNIVCFPCHKLGIEILVDILKGGADKVTESGGLLVGGHTINDEEPKYGLSVTGLVHPDEIFTKGGAQAGDILILTKPLGSGIITTAHKGEMVSQKTLQEMTRWMAALNGDAAEAAHKVGSRCCTDITGFGLLGHSYEILQESRCGAVFYMDRIPLVNEVFELAEQGLVPGGARSNRAHLEEHLVLQENIDEVWLDILCDPQTSGGLLMAVHPDRADQALDLLRNKTNTCAAPIGEVTSDESGKIIIRKEP